MAKITNLTLNGASGTAYTLGVYPLDQAFKAIGGVYVVTKRTPKTDGSGTHDVLYVGQTGDLDERFNAHHKESAWLQRGANCINVLVENNEQRRLSIEDDLIRGNEPPCNG